MPKHIEDIIIPLKRKTIRDIPIPSNRKKSEHFATAPSEERKIKHHSKKKLWVASGVVLLLLIFGALAVFDGATLAYVPKSANLSFKGDVYTARRTGENLSYSIVKLSKDKEKSVPASGTEEVKRKASGTIVVYNSASAPQKLIENTRFQTSEGKVYRIKDAVIVPANGFMEALAYADEAGDSYNVGLSDFTLPGLAGTSKFKDVYGRSKTPMAGGFIGKEAVVKNEDKAKATSELEAALREELLAEAKAQVPDGFSMFPNLVAVNFETLPSTALSGANAVIKVKGDFAGMMFKKSDLSNQLANSKIKIASGELVDIMPLESLEVSFAGNAPKDLISMNEINLSVTGDTTAVWRTNETALKTDLAGRSKRDIPAILNNYPAVVSATATVRPFWKNSFPLNSAKITIKKNAPK
ncbi:MAG: hypothetical protein HYS51_00540 [Candidatus Zambryskibacteria bacterium]|nr:hypothetical protein [Candidatus Zambryskibacteria bacterium]